MAEVGLIPPAPAPAVADTEAEAPAEQVAASVEEAVPEEPALDVTPPADAGSVAEADNGVDEVVAATFGLLRAEPDGSVVIAGSGIPGSRVEVFANGELLGAVEVEATGDWVFVPESPLPPGGLEITLGEEGKPGEADDSFIVVINEDRTSQPLVVASKPGEASEVLQGLTAPAQVAQAEEPAAPAAADPGAATEAPQPEAAPAQQETPVAESSAMMAAAEPVESEATPSAEADAAAAAPEAGSQMTIAALPEPAAAPTEAIAEPAPAAPEPVSVQEPAAVAEAPQAPAPEAPAPQAPAPETPVPDEPASSEPTAQELQAEVPASAPGVEPAASTPDEPEVEPAAEPAELPPPVTAQPQLAGAPLTIDAIEIETDRTFFAGAGPNGGIVRLYVDDTYVADATIFEGRWLVEAGPVLNEPSQRVRADLLQPNSAAVVARAEVDFVVDLPAVEAPMAVAEAPASEPTAPETAAPTPASEPAPEVAVAPEPAAPAVSEPATAAAPETPAVAAPAAQPAPAADPAPVVPAAPADQPATAAATSAAAEPAPAPAPVPAPVEPVATAETPADAAPAQPAVPTMVAVSLGDPDAQRFVSGKAIIRRGDNLWTIARRVYGEGLKYTTIYQANTGQIRDPDRIYPGQVFDLPLDAISQ